ncbi:hypothetical protein BX666DRAFT_478058 [Dichotomocladium elegans]|nr:hypothetical protein BX666DRAFT_478058 [Dichotomocladium elegans]
MESGRRGMVYCVHEIFHSPSSAEYHRAVLTAVSMDQCRPFITPVTFYYANFHSSSCFSKRSKAHHDLKQNLVRTQYLSRETSRLLTCNFMSLTRGKRFRHLVLQKHGLKFSSLTSRFDQLACMRPYQLTHEYQILDPVVLLPILVQLTG